MGRTQKPLKIAVLDPDLCEHPKLRELAEKGHEILPMTPFFPEDLPDLVIGRRAWYMDLDHLKYLDVALKAARKTRYAKGEES